MYALSRQATLAYTVQTVPEEILRQQEASFAALLQTLGKASFEQIHDLMAEREEVEAEPGLTPDIVQKLQQKIADKQHARQST